MWKKWIDRLAWTVLGIGSLILFLAVLACIGFAIYKVFVDIGVLAGLLFIVSILTTASFVWVLISTD